MKILAYRFSSFGDVALTIPVLRGLLEENKELEITFLSRPVFKPLFEGIPRLNYMEADLDDFSGLSGLYRLYRTLATYQWDHVVDLHSVLRTWILNSFFRMAGQKVWVISKGRAEKNQLTRRNNKRLTRLPHVTTRYLKPFQSIGLTAKLSYPAITLDEGGERLIGDFLSSQSLTKEGPWIAMAPFSKHLQKEWPLTNFERLLEDIPFTVFLFGAGRDEASKLNKLAGSFDHVYNVADVLTLEQELDLLQHIDVMVSMDSFNMHLAALSGIPVVSIWGATHHFAGFGPGEANENLIVERTDLDCRPCSVFGNKRCFRGDLACLEIPVSEVRKKIDVALKKH